MVENLLTALLQDLVSFLSLHKDFFEKSSADREKMLKDNKTFPEEIKRYLIDSSDKEFMHDLEAIVEFVSSTDDGYRTLKNKIFKALAEFFVNRVPYQLDNYSSVQLPLYDGQFGAELSTSFASTMEKELIDKLQSFLALTGETPLIVVQTPLLLDNEQKANMRKELNGKYPNSIPTFSVNKSLIGGLRVFIDGKTHDHSWLSKINQLTSITT